MAITSAGTGTKTATGGEDTLDTETTAGVYVLVIDTSNMVNGDIVVFRIKTKAISGGTSRLAYQATYAHVQGEPNKYSMPVPVANEIVCTLEQTAGTNRDYYWELLTL